MLVIAPMPVVGIHDREALAKISSERSALPVLPMEESATSVEEVEPSCVVEAAAQPRLEIQESPDTLAATFMVDKLAGKAPVVLPPRKTNGTRPIAKAHAGKSHGFDDTVLRRPSLVTFELPQQRGGIRRILFNRHTLLAMLILLVLLFLAAVAYTVKKFSAADSANEAPSLSYVQVHQPDFSHLKEKYGERIRAAELKRKMAPENLKTRIVQEENPGSE